MTGRKLDKMMLNRNFKHYDNHVFQKLKQKCSNNRNFSIFHTNICSLQPNSEILKLLAKTYRSSLPEVFCKKGVLRNFAKFTCARVSFWIKLQAFPRTSFLPEHLRWLLLNLIMNLMLLPCVKPGPLKTTIFIINHHV